jgi:hypothetical protein
LTAQGKNPPVQDRGITPDLLAIGLQLVRASSLTMTRLQLALQSGDRRRAMMAMDGLMDIDAEIEGFVSDLAPAPGEDAHWQALAGYLENQKAAIAVEKHALTGVAQRPDLPRLDMPVIPETAPADPTAQFQAEMPQTDAVAGRTRMWLITAILACILGIAGLVAIALGL